MSLHSKLSGVKTFIVYKCCSPAHDVALAWEFEIETKETHILRWLMDFVDYKLRKVLEVDNY